MANQRAKITYATILKDCDPASVFMAVQLAWRHVQDGGRLHPDLEREVVRWARLQVNKDDNMRPVVDMLVQREEAKGLKRDKDLPVNAYTEPAKVMGVSEGTIERIRTPRKRGKS